MKFSSCRSIEGSKKGGELRMYRNCFAWMGDVYNERSRNVGLKRLDEWSKKLS